MIVIAGPCVIEDYDQLAKTAEYISRGIEDKMIGSYFKASCIKDNRTTVYNFGGVGFLEGIPLLQRIKKEFGLKITTDFHTIQQVNTYGREVDLIQIPAYLAQQTSLLKAASKLGKPIHIKKPQFLGPLEANKIVEKLEDLDFKDTTIVSDRGTMFGYNLTMMDPRHIDLLEATYVLADITHPNKNYPGHPQDNARALGMASIAAGADGVFLETASNCEDALCDSGTMLYPEYFTKLIDELYGLWKYISDEGRYK